MPSDPLSFDEIKLPFIFVPHGEPEPTEWLHRHPDYIKLPATFMPRAHGDRQADPVAGAPPPAQRNSAGGPAASSDPGGSMPQAENGSFEQAHATPGIAPLSSDPIAAYRMASDALGTAASAHASGRDAGPDAPTGAVASDATRADLAHTDAGQAEDPTAPDPFVDDQGKPVLGRH
jgi:hypothetical protein